MRSSKQADVPAEAGIVPSSGDRPSSVPALAADGPEFGSEAWRALTTWGAFLLRGAPIGLSLLEGAGATAAAFFAAPVEEKRRSRSTDGAGQRGWSGLGPAQASARGGADLKEYWQMGRPDAHPPNVWPVDRPTFRAAHSAVFEAADLTGRTLLAALASSSPRWGPLLRTIGLGGDSVLRTLWYPPAGDDADATRAHEHADIDLLSLFLSETGPGLDLVGPEGHPVPVRILPGTVLVAAGEMLERVTGGTVRALMHRVRPAAGSTVERQSTVFFAHPAATAVLGEQDGRALTAEEFLHQRIAFWSRR